MKKATVIITAILAVILMLNFGFLLYVGGSIVYYYTDGLMDIAYDILFSSMGIMVTVTAVPVLIQDTVQYRKRKKGKRDLIFSLGLVLVGVFMTFYGIVALLVWFLGANLFMELEDALGVSWKVEEVFTSAMRVIRWLFAAPSALYLIIAPTVRMIFTKEKALQYRVFVHQPVLGVVLLALTVLGSVVVMLQRPTGTVMKVLGFALAVFAVAYLIAALAGLSKAIKTAKQRELQEAQEEQEAQKVKEAEKVHPAPKKQTEQKASIDLPFNLPAGVNADDL